MTERESEARWRMIMLVTRHVFIRTGPTQRSPLLTGIGFLKEGLNQLGHGRPLIRRRRRHVALGMKEVKVANWKESFVDRGLPSSWLLNQWGCRQSEGTLPDFA